MNTWIKFFVGTPQRLLVTLCGIAILAAFSQLFPGLILKALNQLVAELTPLFTLALFLLILYFGLKVVVGGNSGKKKGGKK